MIEKKEEIEKTEKILMVSFQNATLLRDLSILIKPCSSHSKIKNMKKIVSTISFAVVLITATFQTSCNSGKKEFDLTADNPSIKGGLKDYIEVASGSYKLTKDESENHILQGTECNTWNLSVKLRSKQKTAKSFQEIENPIMGPLSLQLIDDKGNPPSFGKISYNGSTDILKKLLKDGEENFFIFSFCCHPDEMKNVILTKFYLNTNATEYTETTSSSSNEGGIPLTEFKIGNQDKQLFKMVEGGKTDIAFSQTGAIEVTTEFEVVKTFTGKAKYNQAFVSLVALDSHGKTVKLSSTDNGEMRSDDSEGKEFLDFLMGEPKSKVTMIFHGQVNQEGTFNADATATKEAAAKIVAFKVLTDR